MKKHTNWTEYDEGHSIGTSGESDGAIIRDDEHKSGARITLEEESSLAEFVINCNIYGWMFHTRLLNDETEAQAAFDEMKDELDEILETLPLEAGGSEEEQENFAEELAAFVERFP